MTNLVPEDGSLDLSLMRGQLVVNGEMLDDALQKRRIIKSFIELVEVKKLSSITFWPGLSKDELRRFLVLLAARVPAKDFDEVTHIYEELKEQEIEHIEVDEQVYVAISRREKVVDVRAAVEHHEDAVLKGLKDEVFARFITGEAHLSDIDPSVAREIMADPEKMVAMVQGVIRSQGWDAEVETLPYRIDETRGILQRLSELIAQVENPAVRSKLGSELGKITAQIDAPQLTDMLVTSTGTAGSDTSGLSNLIIPMLGDAKLEGVAGSAIEEYRSLSSMDTGDEWPTSRMVALRSVIESAIASATPELAQRLSAFTAHAGIDFQREDETTSTSGTDLAIALMSGGDAGLSDEVKAPSLVVAAGYLFENDRDDLGSMVTEKISEKFTRQSDNARPTAARQLWGLFEVLRDLGKETFAGDLADDVSKVLDSEKGAVFTYDALTRSMDEVAGDRDDEVVSEGIESLRLGTGTAVSTNAIERLMASDTGQVVRAVFESGDKSAQEAVSKALLGMADRAAPALIATAEDCTDQETLQSIADTLNQLKVDPSSRIAARFQQELETFQLVNLTKLMALVGGESSAPFLAPLLGSEDADVKAEAIRAIGGLGGRKALQMLLNETAELDVSMRSTAVRELGKFDDYLAVRRLLEIVTPGKKGEPADDETVMIAACKSLGELRVRQAAPALSEVATMPGHSFGIDGLPSHSFKLRGRKHEAFSETLRAAATSALGMIGGQDAARTLKHLVKDPSMLVRSTARKALQAR